VPGARRVLVTGAASGIGLETALALGRRGDHVVVADRDVAGGEVAVARIARAGGSAELRALDLSDLAAIRSFAAGERVRGEALDVLINNAGLLPPMVRSTTRDGFELVLGVAYLGHFALTGLLLPALGRSEAPRVVSVASLAHARGRIDLEDLQLEHRYLSSRAYANAKLACLMFALELHRRATAAGLDLISVAAHPGIARTPIAAGWEREGRRRLRDRFDLWGYRVSMRLFGQTAAEGARSLVFAASDPGVVGGGYYGPTGFAQMGGTPGPVEPSERALDPEVAGRLWEASERLTGVRYELNRAPAFSPSGTPGRPGSRPEGSRR
jgi:NAD(P)-dependent dehydrogenase (short-subunit alcohol dehydrogenase family)